MKKTLVLLLMQLVAFSSTAQIRYDFNSYNSNKITAILCYRQNAEGFYYKLENLVVDKLDYNQVKKYYAYDKKNQKLYCVTNDGNYVIELKDLYSRIYKRSTTIPQLKEKEINPLVVSVNNNFIQTFDRLNQQHQLDIERKKAQERADSIKKAQEDSIRKVKEERARQEHIEQLKNYAKTHKWRHVPVNNQKIYCSFCEKTVETSDTLICVGATNDSIAWLDVKEGALEVTYFHNHKGYVPKSLRSTPSYSFHYEAFKDSLNANYRENVESGDISLYNVGQFIKYMNELKKKAPNGFFEEWEWDDDFSLKFSFTYRNTNKKTIKYIEVFWKAMNAVGDLRNTGSFKGTGPVEEWDCGRWEWDHSRYYLAGDASTLRITKVVITYMDNKQVVIPQNKLLFN